MNKLKGTVGFDIYEAVRENTSLNLDILSSLLGDQIGVGAFRAVYENKLDENSVIKLEGGGGRCNIQEEIIWYQVQYLIGPLAWVKDWFAPVIRTSPNGRVLCMAKTTPHDGKKKLPKEVPAFLHDVKLDNFGRYKGKFVCHDYSTIYGLMNFSKKMKKTSWDY